MAVMTFRPTRPWWSRHLPVFLLCMFFLSLSEVQASGSGVRATRDPGELEFSARLTWRTNGKTSHAQLFVKGDRYRIEHRGGVKTDLGYATVTIVRLDKQQVWYILSQRRLVMAVPLTLDYMLPLAVRLEGEVSRSLIGDAMVGEQQATLYEVVVDRHDRRETYYQWIDETRQLLLKLVSLDRDWSVEYGRVVLSKQPEYFFETPLGYRTFQATEKQADEG
ncbi:MAG: hypothetical protein F4090_03840 [Nitrospira sp. SB0672_bin_25]|nr:hypothetical protein [Nitrospira sp. SB0666_bin_27]MYC28260.1 hypothetical protein [Nitrospira sp. SB0662_bin_26]MYJ54028.1 hypothetical protein [Nitrospira sp. SB0672_bin_25]